MRDARRRGCGVADHRVRPPRKRLQEKLHAIQHEYFGNIVSSMHVHLDEHMCLEVIVLRGHTELVQSIANLILGTKGVQNGKLVLTVAEYHHEHE